MALYSEVPGNGVQQAGCTSMSDARYTIDLDLHEKLLKIVNLQVDSQLKLSQRAFLPWQFTLSVVTVAFTAGAALMAGVFALARWKVGG